MNRSLLIFQETTQIYIKKYPYVNPNDENYWIAWYENDLCRYLNREIALLDEINERTRFYYLKAFPEDPQMKFILEDYPNMTNQEKEFRMIEAFFRYSSIHEQENWLNYIKSIS